MNNKEKMFIPATKSEIKARGWNSLDILLISGDAYVDHPSFGTSLIARVLEKEGFRVGIIAQPNFPGQTIKNPVCGSSTLVSESESINDFKRLGTPKLFIGISSGTVDSMLNNYTANRKKRSDDFYSPGGTAGLRPDNAIITYSKICKKAFPGVPIVLGGIEASLRRVAYYDFLKNKILPPILFQAEADILVYGMGEKQCLGIARTISNLKKNPCFSMDSKDTFTALKQIPGISFKCEKIETHEIENKLTLPSCDEIKNNKKKLLKTTLLIEAELNPFSAKTLIQHYRGQSIVVTPPSKPLTEKELDALYELPFTKEQHYSYYENALLKLKNSKKAFSASIIPAAQMIKFSITTHRGCFGGCSFCGLGLHQGKIIQARSQDSIIKEIKKLEFIKGYTGIVSDIGGPTANMYGLNCKNELFQKKCEKPSCLYPKICANLNTSHSKILSLMTKIRSLSSLKKVFVASGIRHDLALEDKKYIFELVSNFTGGHLKTAPENIDEDVLRLMRKPPFDLFIKFLNEFNTISCRVGKEQYIVPYFISNFPGCTNKAMQKIYLWLKKQKKSLKQVQSFWPIPMTIATAMYYSGINPYTKKPLYVSKTLYEKKIQQLILQPHKKFIKKRS